MISPATGMKNRFRMVDASIPPNTAVPSERLAPDPAPVATTSGNTPSRNANDVIKIGRSRVSAASIAASTTESPRS